MPRKSIGTVTPSGMSLGAGPLTYPGYDPFSSPATPVLTDFITQLNQQKIDFWLFDK